MSKKNQILETALDLFVEKGFDKTPTSLISKEAGVATGTLFHHFKNKEELINALYLEVKVSLMEEINEGFRLIKGLKDKLYFIWYTHLSWVMSHQKKFHFLIQFGESPHITQRTRQRVEESFRYIFDTIEKGKQEGAFHNIPLDLLMSISHAHLIATSNYFIENPQSFKDPQIIKDTFESFWCALKRE